MPHIVVLGYACLQWCWPRAPLCLSLIRLSSLPAITPWAITPVSILHTHQLSRYQAITPSGYHAITKLSHHQGHHIRAITLRPDTQMRANTPAGIFLYIIVAGKLAARFFYFCRLQLRRAHEATQHRWSGFRRVTVVPVHNLGISLDLNKLIWS